MRLLIILIIIIIMTVPGQLGCALAACCDIVSAVELSD